MQISKTPIRLGLYFDQENEKCPNFSSDNFHDSATNIPSFLCIVTFISNNQGTAEQHLQGE